MNIKMVYKKSMFKKTVKKQLTAPVKREITKQVKKIEKKDREVKYFDLDVYSDIYDGTPINRLICQIPQGITDSERIGDRVHLRMINLRLGLVLVTDDTNPTLAEFPFDGGWRVMIIQDRSYNTSTNGPFGEATIPLNQLLKNDPTTGAPGVYSQRIIDHLQTLVVLYDKYFTTFQIQKNRVLVNINVPMKWCKRQVQWANASALTQITNGVYIVVFNTCSSTTTKPHIETQIRVLYDDA